MTIKDLMDKIPEKYWATAKLKIELEDDLFKNEKDIQFIKDVFEDEIVLF